MLNPEGLVYSVELKFYSTQDRSALNYINKKEICYFKSLLNFKLFKNLNEMK